MLDSAAAKRSLAGNGAQSLNTPSAYDEMHDADGGIRAAYAQYCTWFGQQDPALLRRKAGEAERTFRRTGITFNV